jgi:hypothetical protein
LSLVRAATKSACLALAQTTRARVIVDISKRPLDAVVLAGIPTVDHYIVHMFRDPRAVVHSWRRAKSFTAAGESRTMGTRGLTSTVRRWMRNSVSAEALRRRVPESRWLTMRYEDLAASPRTAVAAVLDLMEETGRAPFLSDDTVLLRPNHIVAGNPSRFDTGPVTIRSDDAWRVEMPGRDQRLVSLLTRPLLGRYGYPP